MLVARFDQVLAQNDRQLLHLVKACASERNPDVITRVSVALG